VVAPRIGTRRWVPGTGTAVGLAMGAALGSTIFENLALNTGIGLVLGALVDLRRSGEAVAGTGVRASDAPKCDELLHGDDQ
jgi:hypothetical protein